VCLISQRVKAELDAWREQYDAVMAEEDERLRSFRKTLPPENKPYLIYVHFDGHAVGNYEANLRITCPPFPQPCVVDGGTRHD
jgi:hypothetical protein